MKMLSHWNDCAALGNVLLVGSATVLLYLFICLHRVRQRIGTLAKQGLSMPPHHPIWGHLPVAIRLRSKLPIDAHPQYLPGEITKTYPGMGSVFNLDLWPFSRPFLIVSSPSAAYQMTQEHSLPKSDGLRNYMRPLAENTDLVSAEGLEWKYWRNIFNPAFSASHLVTQIPRIVEEASLFCEILTEHAQAGRMFLLQEATIALTVDTIGKVVLDTKFSAQKKRNEFVEALHQQIRWLTFGTAINPIQRLNPIRSLVNKYYKWRMDRYIGQELDRRFVEVARDDADGKKRLGASKTVMDLALDSYLKDHPGSRVSGKMDPTFRSYAIRHSKVFVLAGHDTTSTVLCYVYHLLSQNSHALAQVRKEHDAAFGSNPAEASSCINERPHALNQLPFTTAVIKEAMRLFPPASTSRNGEPGFILEEEGRHYPTDGFIVWCLHQKIHREPRYWHEPDSFIPERWLVSKEDALYPIKGALRPFEFGPRNCIGQELAMLELKIVMVMTLRRFNIDTAFEELDRIHPRPGPQTVNGERAYQILDGANRGPHGFPSRVTVRKQQ